ncbi:MAG: dihydrolipoyl dehydrogenase [Bacteroidales bacterium]|nr:dihydrolipoyl dehydrogenase [Bacteroidales bacterium]
MKIIIIGAGPGGYETALLAARRGVEVVLVESGHVGGTCLNEGCIPTKSFCRNAQILDELRAASAFGVTDLSYGFDFSAVRARKDAVVEQLRGGVEGLLNHKNITLVRGKASFKDAHTIIVDDEEYSADYIIIATGSVSASLPIPGADLPDVLTSREILDIEEVPKRLCVIGGGVIGLEFASIFRSFGSEVTVLEYCRDILPHFDSDLAKRLKQSLGKRGIDMVTQAQVLSITKDASCLVTYSRKGKEETVVADKVLMAVGRRANVSSLNLADIGLEFTPKGISVNDVMQTNLPHIYAVGDINGKMMLAHAATFQGVVALDHIMGVSNGIDLSVMPAAVFTSPEAASVGMTEDECKEKGLAVKCLKSFFRANGKAVAMGETDGFCKLVVELSGRILGCHIYGPHASDIVQEACAMISRGASLEEFQNIIHAHPTLTEVLQSASAMMEI